MLKSFLNRIFDSLSGVAKRVQSFVVLIVLHKILIPTLLFLTYFLVFGVASAVLRIFGRRLLKPHYMTQDSCWIKAEGYEADIERCRRQS